MADIQVRALPDWVLDVHRVKAEAAGVSLEEELRRVLTDAAAPTARHEAVRKAAAMREKLRQEYGELSDSTPGIRADRDARG
jgi:plasmid stability protein